ncbi:hypothetical protein B0A48_09818 [Cryoendolithus antarcticus]|uniref:UBL3-like ubiquitin domain-containing protein n=1 Tax=Cryoendolithus antarcticus TaxID=1507870 RepID=A0A1V8T2T3_9PEZI|nr:hypothetical protein B0A48_09818 [Cryoendolithus antarcticus]
MTANVAPSAEETTERATIMDFRPTAEGEQAQAGASATEDAQSARAAAAAHPPPPAITTTDPSGETTHEPKEESISSALQPNTLAPAPIPLNRSQTAELALGPDGQPAAPLDTTAAALRITLMLTTGARHAYTISQKYLQSRKVEAEDAEGKFDPRCMSGYKLKELIWTDWRPEWEPRPRDPSSIRLIIMGRMLDDKIPLKDLPFNLDASNVVHMTIKPADLMEDEAEAIGKTAKGGSIRARAGADDSGAGCRAVAQDYDAQIWFADGSIVIPGQNLHERLYMLLVVQPIS